MAEASKKPRIRKSAPSIREKVQAEQQKMAAPSKRPKLPQVSLPSYKFLSPFKMFFRLLAKVLGWLVPRYFINAWREVRQVTWPGRGETWRLTTAVFIFALVFGAFVAGVDRGLDEIFKKLVLK